MSAKLDSPFKFEARYNPETRARVPAVGIACRKCSTTAWHAAQNPGWGRRIFKNKGWHIGASPTSHLCPDCVKGTRQGKFPENRVSEVVLMPMPETAVVAPPPTETIYIPSAEARLPSPEELRKGIEPPPPDNSVMADKLKAAMAAANAPPAPRGQPFGFSNASNARMAARTALHRLGISKPTIGEHYKVEKDPDGTYRYRFVGGLAGQKPPPPVHTRQSPPGKRVARWAHARRAAEGMVRSLHVPDPQMGRDFKIHGSSVDGFYYTLLGDLADRVPEVAIPKKPAPDPNKARAARLRNAETLTGYVKPGNAQARAELMLGNPKAAPGTHYRLQKEPSGTWEIVFLDRNAPPPKSRVSNRNRVKLLAKMDRVDTRIRRPYGDDCTRSHIVASAETMLRRLGVKDPTLNQDFELIPTTPGRFTWDFRWADAEQEAPKQQEIAAAPDPQPETIVSDASTQAVRDAEEAQAAAIARQPTIADNRRVRAAVEERYDEDQQRWMGNWTDKTLSEHLKVPRAWVTHVREMYGPDVNDDARLRLEAERTLARQRIEEATKLATEAKRLTEVVIENAARLETTLSLLEIKRKELGL